MHKGLLFFIATPLLYISKSVTNMDWEREEPDRNCDFLYCVSMWHLCCWYFHRWSLVMFSVWCFVLFWTACLGTLGCLVGGISAKCLKTIKATCPSCNIDPSHISRKNFSYGCTCRRLWWHTSPYPENCEIAKDQFLIAEVNTTGDAGTLRSCCRPVPGPLCPCKHLSFPEKQGSRRRKMG